jgi:Cytochrome C'
MRAFQAIFFVVLTIFVGSVVLTGQGGPQEPPCDLALKPAMALPKPGAVPPSGMSPKARIKDIMNSMMVPSSSAVWNSVATVTDATGVHESRPRTDEDWNNVYHAAVELAEVPNLLLVPGRERCMGGAIPQAYRLDFSQKARELQEAANVAVIAAKKHDVDGISEAGERIDVACDACHEKYQIAAGDPENWKKVLGTYKLTPEEVAAGLKDKAEEEAAAKAKAAAPAPKK